VNLQKPRAHGGVWECPDLFKLKVGTTNEEKWVLLISINPVRQMVVQVRNISLEIMTEHILKQIKRHQMD
jgi:sucrose-6-phosphate hydrolase SacC (GH32 family)